MFPIPLKQVNSAKYLGTSNLTRKKTDCFRWKEGSSGMPRPLQTSAYFWYRNITKCLLFNLSSSPLCNFDPRKSPCNVYNSSEGAT